ncbi:protein bunched, class 2/F/G isoform isoform X2 [Cardiocondyla obscurior]|uniref:protein bunched, class 2/F/G isoform isoform X2 n=1 Tax=Cardiocondyla obscurior TaxID=286306 RepID=UPI00396561F7
MDNRSRVTRQSHRLSDGSKKTSNPVHRTTTETIRLGEIDRHYQPVVTPNSVQAVSGNQCNRKKTSSFQITSVTVGCRMSNDAGEDSNDDLDESHTEDNSMEHSRITDLDIETPSYSEETFSKEDVFFNTSTAALSTAPVIPTSSQYGLAIVPSEGGNINNSVNDSNINTLDITSVTDKQDADLRDVHSHGRNERFKVVKIESTEPFKRGRWTCMDYLDHTSVNQPTVIGTSKVSDPNEVCISYGVTDSGIVIPEVAKQSIVTEDKGISIDANGPVSSHSDVAHPSIAVSNNSTQSISSATYTVNNSISPNVQHNATSTQVQAQTANQSQSQTQTQSQTQPQPQPQPQTQTQSPNQGQSQTQTQNQAQTQTQSQTKVQQPSTQYFQSQTQSIATQSQQKQPQQQQQPSQTSQSSQSSTLPSNLQVTHPNNLGQPQSMPQGSIPIITQTSNSAVTSQPSISHSKEETYVTVSTQSQSLPVQNVCQSTVQQASATSQTPNIHVTQHQSEPTSCQQSLSTQISDPLTAVQGKISTMQNVHKVSQSAGSPQQTSSTIHSSGAAVQSQVMASTTQQMQPQTSNGNASVQITQVTAGCQNVVGGLQQGNIAFHQTDPEQESISGIVPNVTVQSADTTLLESLAEVTQSSDEHRTLEDNESVSGTSAVAIDNKIEQAMDLVKSHLMFAVREEVEVLKEKIAELMDRINQLEAENSILKAHATSDTLAQLSQSAAKLSQNNSGSGQ